MEIISCQHCPRLVEWRERVARVVILGLAHGANRTGRFFTGDFLFAGLHRAGFSNNPTPRDARLRDLWITAAVRCAPPANRPTPAERDTCLPYVARELDLLDARVVVCLGAFAWDAALRLFRVKPKPRFVHGAEHALGEADGPVLLGCYHPSQQNTFTGVLTPSMLDAILARAGDLAGRRTTGKTVPRFA